MELAVQNGRVGYTHHAVLRSVNFSLRPGQFAGLVGPNGAGKSTLLRTLAGILPPLNGDAVLNGKNLKNFSRRDIGRHIACLSQQRDIPFAYSALETVLMGRTPYLAWNEQESAADRNLAEACLEILGMGDKKDRTMDRLSGGERQRVLLARTLLQGTEFILLDEPTAELDFVAAEKVFSLCRILAGLGRGVAAACHDLPLAARFCTDLVLVGQNKILAAGPPEKILTADLLSTAYGAPVLPRWQNGRLVLQVEENQKENKQWQEKIRAIVQNTRGGTEHGMD